MSDATDPVEVAAKIAPLKEPSEEFLEAFSDGVASMVTECEFCGRVYFATRDHGDYEKGEMEHYREMAEKEPDKYIEVDYFTSRIGVDGRCYAWGCKCNKVRMHEEWVWANRRKILAYLTAMFKERLEKAKEDSEALDGAKTAIKLLEDAQQGERRLLRDLLNKYPDENGIYSGDF